MKTSLSEMLNWDSRFAGRTCQMRRSSVRELLKLTAQPDMISLAGGLPAPELFPVEQVKEATERVFRRQAKEALQYGETEGFAALREWIANRFRQSGLPVKRANVLVTSGAQQAIDLVGRVLLDPGDKVLIENPTYLAMLLAWRPLGIQFLPVPTDSDGMCVESIAPLLEQQPKLVYCMPNFQNPQGTTLSRERRVRLLQMLHQRNVALVEDNAYGDLRYTNEQLPSLVELNAEVTGRSGLESNIIHLGTFSKVLAPGLRVGWVLAPEPVIEKLVQAKQAADLNTSTLSQHIVYEIVKDGFLDDHIPRLRQAYRERRDALLSALETNFSDQACWTHPKGGMFLMLSLAKELSATALLKHALERKVAFVPGEEFHVDGKGTNTLRLNFTNAPSDAFEEAVKRLTESLDSMDKERSPRPRPADRLSAGRGQRRFVERAMDGRRPRSPVRS